MPRSSSIDVANVAFEELPHLTKVWVKGDDYHIVDPLDLTWDLIEKGSSKPEKPSKPEKTKE